MEEASACYFLPDKRIAVLWDSVLENVHCTSITGTLTLTFVVHVSWREEVETSAGVIDVE